MIIFVKSAPKLGHILFDPLDYEANLPREITSETESTTGSQYLRSNLTIQNLTTKASNNSNGYGFDETICKEKNDRILCGYNKNKDNLGIEEMSEETENGCRIRGDRLECGYLVGPFTNPRRPPANYEENEDTNNTQSELYHNTTQATVATSEITSTKTQTTVQSPIFQHSKNLSTSKLNISTTITPTKITTNTRPEFLKKLIVMQNSKNKTLKTTKTK
ncbi:uncharacterized protein LOC106716703 [Papilio machaon]|uniref:uncharacterized protein LOC106716703 n=1 Tax=Papilio machaon TaxID=76193 RepID=UPI001E665A52|nr:uncharacterized protein LOC106716703 [Papilio machaon]